MNLSTGSNETFQACEFKEHLNILRQIYFFSKLPLETLKVFAYLCTRELFKAGDYLFRQGEDDGQAFYLLSGQAQLIREGKNRTWEIREYGPEDFISATAMIGHVHRLYSLRAVSDITCLVMPRDKFSRAMEQFPDLMPQVLRTVVERLYAWEEQFLTHHAEEDDAAMKSAGISLI
ncbi:cyclic nucleotide-binding domain-containing prot ein [Desulfonema ishimotonii]|uniref:Cyclic nucleotide-binding domain-containing prot ein n=1 Tax=Desulfonema ishimotonii TaxID=45657 RepID=A0A401G2Y9_9BACT|nr:Crp/Fnr family transcriptional regulator [Desulfonema ishimotonii]GBC63485.1 cyclic nucleotide-binding domain-containing prot ein [Desulfonema ishimotonii]